EHADLRGNVKVDSAQLAMTSDELGLRFDPTQSPAKSSTNPAAATAPTTAPLNTSASTLRQIAASGNVKCRIINQGNQQTIESKTLRVETDTGPNGKTYARQLQADGQVRTSENGRTLEAEHLLPDLAPTTRPASPAAPRPADLPAPAPTRPAATIAPAPTP